LRHVARSGRVRVLLQPSGIALLRARPCRQGSGQRLRQPRRLDAGRGRALDRPESGLRARGVMQAGAKLPLSQAREKQLTSTGISCFFSIWRGIRASPDTALIRHRRLLHAVALTELLDLAGGVEDVLLAGVERM